MKSERPLRPSQCRVYLRRELAHSFRAIVRGFVKQAESGSVQHLKLTTELLEQQETAGKRKGSALRLLEEFERMDLEKAAKREAATPVQADAWLD